MAFGPKPWKDKPDGTTPISAAALIDLETRLGNYSDSLILMPSVTSLPPSPTDGQQVDYWPSGTAGTGVCWRCTWRGAANSGAGAWIVAGGASLYSTIGGGFGLNTGTLTTYTAYTGGPTVTLTAGVWDAVWSGVAQSANAGWSARLRLAVNGVGQSRYIEHAGIDAFEGGTRGDPVGERLTLSITSTVTLQGATNGIQGALGDWRIRATPIELRP